MSDPDNKSTQKLTAYERWELPHLENKEAGLKTGPALLLKKEQEVETEEVDQDSLVYEPLTASQLEEIRSAAYDEGFVQGESEGHEKGHQDGYSKGEVDGFEKGHEEGFKVGQQEGLEEAQQQAEEKLAKIEALLSEVVAEIVSPLEASRSAAESLLYQTMARMVENVCLTQLEETAQTALKEQLSKTFAAIGEYEGRVRLSLHPNDVEILETLNIKERLALQVEEDATMLEGGFVIDSKAFHVDGRVEQRLDEVCNELRQLSTAKQD